MERRIKILNLLTIAAIAAFCAAQGLWLRTRFMYTLHGHEQKLYGEILQVMDEDFQARRSSPDQRIGIATVTSIIGGNNGHEAPNYIFEIYIADTELYPKKDTSWRREIINKYRTEQPQGIRKYNIMASGSGFGQDAYDALERFCVDECHPFSVEELKDRLDKAGLHATDVVTEKQDTAAHTPKMISHPSILKPRMTVIYPYDILQGELVRIEIPVSVSPIIREMSGVLAMALALSVLLTSCLLAQISTIRRQRRIEQLRADFIHSVVHELKRPVSTLKICASYMRNATLMNDMECRESVIADSCRELDNLSSYLSRLRELTYSDTADLPLQKTEFSLRDMLEECMSKLDIPAGKKARIDILPQKDLAVIADRMYLSDIVGNLMENAVKYSGPEVHIGIDYRLDGNRLVLTVRDNGYGIAKNEQPYVFDKFFRSRKIQDSGIPGMGLGLAYVQMLAEAHGGCISVDSEEGNGSIFTVTMPQGGEI